MEKTTFLAYGYKKALTNEVVLQLEGKRDRSFRLMVEDYALGGNIPKYAFTFTSKKQLLSFKQLLNRQVPGRPIVEVIH